MLARTALALTLVAAGAQAQLGGLTDGLSSSCQSSALSLLTSSDFATCADLGGLLPVFTASGSVVAPINSWLSSLCTSGTNCTESDINNATAIIDQGCSAEVQAGQPSVTSIRAVVAGFPTVKQGLCLASTSNSSFCVTNLLNDIQNATGTDISVSTLSNLNASSLSSVSAGTVCTDCSHALVSTWSPLFGNNESTITGAITSECGSSFNDGQVPSTVSEKTSANSSSGNGVESSNLNGAGSVALGGWKAAGAALLGAAGVVVLA